MFTLDALLFVALAQGRVSNDLFFMWMNNHVKGICC